MARRGYTEPKTIVSRVLAIVVAIALLAFVGYLIYLQLQTVIELNSIGTGVLFDCTVAEFPYKDQACYEEIGDLREYAMLDDYGAGGKILRLSLPPRVCDRLLESQWLHAADELAMLPRAELSSDFHELDLYLTGQTANTYLDVYGDVIEKIVMKAGIAQLIGGATPRSIMVKINLIDEKTGTVVKTQNWFYQ